MKVTLAITTYDRSEYLIKMQKSLYASKKIEECNIRIYDDCSKSYDTKYLQQLFPKAKSIIRQKKNLKGDGNLKQAMINFLSTDDDIFVITDSDIIFHPDWIIFLTEHINYTEGVMSLFNSILHTSYEKTIINGNPFLLKDAIGAAGTVMNRKIVKIITEKLQDPRGIDWKFSDILKNVDIRLFVSEKSYVQHIGIHGKHNIGYRTDYGLNFQPGNDINTEIMNQYYEELLISIDKQFENLVYKDDINYRLGKFILSPLKLLRHPLQTINNSKSVLNRKKRSNNSHRK